MDEKERILELGGKALIDTYCQGCGAVLQSEDKTKIGYLPPAIRQQEVVLCQRCFRIRHYNEIAPVTQNQEEYLQILQGIANTNSLVVQVIDLFDMDGSWIPGIHRHIGRNPLLLLANKFDVFPRSVKWGRVKDWVRDYAKERGVIPIDVIPISAMKGEYMEEAVEAIDRHRKGRDVYIVGASNVGKSTFLNRLLRDFSDLDREITTSPYPGTTLNTIQIPLAEGGAIYDTPGIVLDNRLSEQVHPKDLASIVPKGRLNPKVYQLQEEQTLFFGGLVRFDFLEGERQPFIVYVANQLYIHRTKLENADKLYERQVGKLFVPPTEPGSLKPWKEHVFHIGRKEKQDLVISGLGWIRLRGDHAKVRLFVPEGVQVLLRSAIL